MKRALTVFGILLFLGLVSWAVPNQNLGDIGGNAQKGIGNFLHYSGFANASLKHLLMITVGLIFLYLAIRHSFEPL